MPCDHYGHGRGASCAMPCVRSAGAADAAEHSVGDGDTEPCVRDVRGEVAPPTSTVQAEIGRGSSPRVSTPSDEYPCVRRDPGHA